MQDSSVTDVKASFIRAQVRQLSAPLQPSTQWKEFIPEPEHGHLSENVIQEVVNKVNEKIKQHSRMVYSAQSQRHIAEQIETLYWNQIQGGEDSGDIDTVAIQRRSDLALTETIRELPEDREDLFLNPERQIDSEENHEYEELRQRLLEMSAKRDEKRQNLARYKQLRDLLVPYEKAQENIQPNLVTKDGELSTELDRMRMLLARVTARMGNANSSTTEAAAINGNRRPVLTDEQNLAQILEMT